MSAGLFGYTLSSYPSTYDYNEKEQLKPGQGYNILKYQADPIYEETLEKRVDIRQPIKYRPVADDLKAFTINDFGRTMDNSYGLFANHYHSKNDNNTNKGYGTEKYIPPSYPARYYNTYKNSATYLGLKVGFVDNIKH